MIASIIGLKNGVTLPWILLICITTGFTNLSAQEEDFNKTLWSARWSPDGSHIVVGGFNNELLIYDTDNFALENRLPITGIQRMSWHPSDDKLAIITTDGAFIVDSDTWSLRRLEGIDQLNGRAIDWNADGSQMAIADYEHRVTIWDDEGNLSKIIEKEEPKGYVGLDWHPENDEFIALSGLARHYHSKNGLVRKFQHRVEEVLMLCIEWHPSGKFYALGDYGVPELSHRPLLQFWSSDGTLQSQSDISNAEYRNIRWNAKGDKLASASDRLRIWSAQGKLLHEGPDEDNLWGVDWSPDGERIVTSSNEGQIKIWDAKAQLIRSLKY